MGEVKQYRGQRITVSYDSSRCIHFAECVRGLPAVFDVNQRPWVDPDNAAPESVAEVVRRCPSGALHYTIEGGEPERPDGPTTIEPVPDGPLRVRGELLIGTPDGPLAEVRAALCRCGLSANAPFCDHACERSGWRSTPPGPAPTEGS